MERTPDYWIVEIRSKNDPRIVFRTSRPMRSQKDAEIAAAQINTFGWVPSDAQIHGVVVPLYKTSSNPPPQTNEPGTVAITITEWTDEGKVSFTHTIHPELVESSRLPSEDLIRTAAGGLWRQIQNQQIKRISNEH
jgi:hypothetical protein